MLAVILEILKIIGLILLAVLALLLLVLALVLLVPLRYEIGGEYHKAPRGQARVSWLLGFLSARVSYDGKPAVVLRVCGIRVARNLFADEEPAEEEPADKEPAGGKPAEEMPAKEKKAGGEPAAETEAPAESVAGEMTGSSAKPAEKPAEPKALEAPGKPADPAAGQEKDEARGSAKKSDSKKKKKRRSSFSIRRICDKLKGIVDGFRQRLSALNQKREELLRMWRDEENRATLRLVKRQLKKLVKHLLPRRLKGRVRFGFDDPYTTGQVLTYASPFYALYARHLELIPVFEGKALDGELEVKGRIRVGTIAVIAVRLLIDKNFRRLLKRVLK